MGSSVIVSDGPTAWKLLNGLFCVYKPAEATTRAVRSALITNLCRTLNELEPRPVGKFVSIEGPTPNDLEVIVRPDYADHPLVVGPRYQAEDIRLASAAELGPNTSGVFVLGLNNGTKKSIDFNKTKPLRTYRLKGILGQVTDNMLTEGKVVQKASFDHIKRHHLDKVLATFQASHQRLMFLQSGVDLQSQTAYELASKGLIRPSGKNAPLVYNLKTITFEPPEFTIEVQAINEYEDYLLKIIYDIGQRLRTLATCSGLQCTRHGCFSTEHALLRRNWTTENVLNNIAQCDRVLKESNYKLDHQPFLRKSESDNERETNAA